MPLFTTDEELIKLRFDSFKLLAENSNRRPVTSLIRDAERMVTWILGERISLHSDSQHKSPGNLDTPGVLSQSYRPEYTSSDQAQHVPYSLPSGLQIRQTFYFSSNKQC